MVRITRRITESSTSTSTSYWHDADAGGSGSTYGDAALISPLPPSSSHQHRPQHRNGGLNIFEVRRRAARSGSGSGSGSDSGSGSGAAAELWADALRAALLGGAASVGYHVTSVLTRMAIRYVEEWWLCKRRRSCSSNRLVANDREGDGEFDDGRGSCGRSDRSSSDRSSSGSRSIIGGVVVSDSHDGSHEGIITMEHRIKSAISQITTTLQGGARRLSQRVKIRLYELRRCAAAATCGSGGSAWPLVLLIVATWPHMLCNSSSSSNSNSNSNNKRERKKKQRERA